MKKIISLALTLTLVLSLAVAAFADTNTVSDEKVTGGSSHTVTGTYKAGVDGGTIYKVDIQWGSMVFTYTDASKGTWNAENHVYDNPVAAKWTCDDGANVISITNHSNAAISVTPSYTAETDYSSATMSFDNATLNLGSADNGQGDNGAGKATTGTITVTAGGTLTKDDKTSAESGTTIGQITLKIQESNASADDNTDADADADTVVSLTTNKTIYYWAYSGLEADEKETLEAVVFTVTYGDGHTKTLHYDDEGLTLTPNGEEMNTSRTGKYVYTATYGGASCTFTMDVYAPDAED